VLQFTLSCHRRWAGPRRGVDLVARHGPHPRADLPGCRRSLPSQACHQGKGPRQPYSDRARRSRSGSRAARDRACSLPKMGHVGRPT